MPTFTLAELVKPVTRQEVQASIYSALAIVGVNTTSWKPGAAPRAIVVGVSVVLAGFSQLMALATKSGFLELSEGPWLTLVAHHVYGVERLEATHASGELALTNASGGEYLLDPGDLIAVNTSSGQTYRNAAAVTIAPFAAATKALFVATEPGAASTSNPGEITELATTLFGVTVTNELPFIGRGAETDVSLRARCSASLGSRSPLGPSDAYTFAARAATRSDGTSCGITRVRIAKDGYGNVPILVATDAGEVPPDDLEIVAAAIEQRAVPYGVNATLASAETIEVTIVTEVWLYTSDDGPDPAEAAAAIDAALQAFILGRPIGGDKLSAAGSGSTGYVFVDSINATIVGAVPGIFHATLASPAADVGLASNAVATLAASTITIHTVPRPSSFGATATI